MQNTQVRTEYFAITPFLISALIILGLPRSANAADPLQGFWSGIARDIDGSLDGITIKYNRIRSRKFFGIGSLRNSEDKKIETRKTRKKGEYRFRLGDGMTFGKIIHGGNPYNKYLKIEGVRRHYRYFLLVKSRTLNSFGGRYAKEKNNFLSQCFALNDWLVHSVKSGGNQTFKRDFSFFKLTHYNPTISNAQAILNKKWFNIIFGRDPETLSWDEWNNILWNTNDCARFFHLSQFSAFSEWFFKDRQFYKWRNNIKPDKNIKTLYTPDDMIKLLKLVSNSKRDLSYIYSLISEIKPGPTAVKDTFDAVERISGELSYYKARDVEDFLFNVYWRMDTLRASASCASKFGLDKCRLPDPSEAPNPLKGEETDTNPPLTEKEKKRFEQIINPNLFGIEN